MPVITPEEFDKLETDNDKARITYATLYNIAQKVDEQPKICKAFRESMERKIDEASNKGSTRKQKVIFGGGGTGLGVLLTKAADKIADWLG